MYNLHVFSAKHHQLDLCSHISICTFMFEQQHWFPISSRNKFTPLVLVYQMLICLGLLQAPRIFHSARCAIVCQPCPISQINQNQSISLLFVTAKTTAYTGATEVFKTRMRALLSRTKVGMFS